MPIVPMTGKPEDSLYPEQKIEINPLSYLNTPDTATEAQFAVAVDELAKLSPFGIRETGDYSQFGADNAKDAFFNLRKATIHGIESLSDDESRTWFDTDPEDIETRYRIASENLPPSQRASLFAGEVVGGIDDMPILSEAEYKVAPPEVREASDRLKVQSGQATDVEAAWDRRPGRDKMRGDFPTITPGFASWDTPPPLPDDADFSGIISQWRDRYNKERTISAYDARIDAKNTLRKWAMMRPLLSDDADGLLQHIMADNPRDDEFDAKFMALPEDQQEVVMMLGRDLRNTPGQNLLRDSVREFLNGGKRLFVDAGREARDIWMLSETDREDFQKQAEIKARMEELWAPKRSQEYGYWEDAIIGTIGSIPYTGFTMATAMAGVPEVGLGVISLSMAHQFKQQIALQGGDVTDPKVLVLAQAAGIAYWGIEQAQVGTWMKSMTDLERRMATANFAHGIWTGYVKFLGKAEAKAKARKGLREAAPKLASDFTGDLLKEWLYEEETQDLIEEGFVSWGIGEDVARNMAEQAVESLQQNFGTMLLMTGGFSGIGAARTGLSRKHTDQELYDAMHHRAQLIGSLHQRTELREKLRKGEEIDQREMKRLERDIDYQRRVLSTMHRAFNKAGGMEDAESAFQRMGLDPRQSFLAAYMFDQERRAIMGDTDLTQAEKEELLGKQATSLSLLRQAYPGRTFTENLDGTFTSSYTLNGAEVREIHQTGTIEWDPASPEGATSAVEAVNLAEKDAALQNDETFPANAKGMTVERWLNLTPEARNEIVKALKLHPEGNFIFTAKMAGSPDVAQVDENQVRRLSGEITLSPDAAPSATFHEDLHAFVRYLRETGELTPQDIQKLREEFGDPRQGVNEDFNEENAAETVRRMQSRSVRHVESTGAEAIMDKVFDVLDRIDLFRRKKKQAETVAENLLGQMRRGEWTGIPTGTITEAQRQKNAQLREKSRAKPKKQAKKPQEPAAKKPEQAQEPSDAEIQPEGQDGKKPTSQAEITPQGEGQTAEEAAAAAEADEIGAGETGEVDADQPLGKGEWRAVTPKGNVYVRGEWVVVDMDDLKTSDQAGYDQSIQPRDRGTVRSRAQIHEIARNLNPAQLLDSARTDDGAPVMMPDGSVMSGNGRVMAMREARAIGNIAKYEAVVRRKAAELGIAIPSEIQNPVLVRRLDSIEGPSTIQQIAELSNQPVILQRSEAEIAESDAKSILDNGLLRLFQPGADGNVLSASNMDFINGLVQATGDASLVDSNNRPTDATRNRIRRALLALLVGEGENSREIVRGLVEDAKNFGMKTEVDGLMKAAADIVTVARDKPQYSLLNDIGLALRMYMDMKREGSSPFQADLFGRPDAVDKIVKAMWGRSTISSIAAIFSDYATRARLVDTSTGGLGLEKDPTKEELLQRAIDSTGTGETVEQAQAKKQAEANAETDDEKTPQPPTTTAANITGPPTVAEDQSVDEIPPPSNITIQPGETPWDQIGKGWKALNTKVKEQYTKWSRSIPLFQGAKRGMSGMATKAIRSAMSKASRDAVRTIWDGFGGSGGWGLYHALENFENADLISIGEYYAPRMNKIMFFHQKGDQAEKIIKSEKFQELRKRIIDAMVSNSGKDAKGQGSLPGSEDQATGPRALTSAGTLADKLKEIVEELYGTEMSDELTDLTAVLQAMADAAANGRQQAADTRSEMFDAVAAIVIRDAAAIREAAKAFEARGGRIEYRTEPDTYKAIAEGQVTPGKETFALIDPPYYLTLDYDPDEPGKIVGLDTYRKTRAAIKRLTEQGNGILYTDSAWWLDHADHAEAGLVVPEDHQIIVDILNDMDHLDVASRNIGNRHEAIGVHHGREIEQAGRRQGNGAAEPVLLGTDEGRIHQPGGTGSGQDADVPGMAEGTAGEAGTVRGGDGAGGSDQARFSVTAAALKRLNSGVYKEEAEQTLRDLLRIPSSLKPYVERYNDPDDLISLAQFAGWKRGPKVATEHRATYRPAVRLKDGRIAWHPRARMHSEALSMWLEQQGIPLDAFDIDEYYGDGGLGPDGRYYEQPRIGDGPTDFEDMREQGRYSVKANRPIATAFYSQLRRTIEAKMPNKATVAQVRATLDPAKGSGVKQDEIFWSGLQEFLDSKKPTDTVTKEEVLAATQEVVVQDVVKGQKSNMSMINEANDDLDQFGLAMRREFDMDDEGEAVRVFRGDEQLDVEDFAELPPEAQDIITRVMEAEVEDTGRADMPEGDVKFAQYVLPGGENYRELLLTLPSDEYHVALQRYAKANDIQDIGKAEQAFQAETGRRPNDSSPDFRSGHFSEPNVVAHVRFNERTSADGKRTLFIEEIQSDWAQKGKKQGFDDGMFEKAQASFKAWSEENPGTDPKVWRELHPELAGKFKLENGVPVAPYVTKTDAWVSLALKRMVRWAAENGFDQVAWTTGEQQAERYDLSKQVESVWAQKTSTGEWNIKFMPAGRTGEWQGAGTHSADKLADVVGKDLAEKIVNEQGEKGTYRGLMYRGTALKVGGEGMKAFYDQIVPNTANKLFKRFGAKASEAWFDLGDPEDAISPPPDDMVDEGGFTAHALPVTPALRDSVLYEGQARFSVKANNQGDAEYMAAVERGDMETAQRIVDEAAKGKKRAIKNASKLERFVVSVLDNIGIPFSPRKYYGADLYDYLSTPFGQIRISDHKQVKGGGLNIGTGERQGKSPIDIYVDKDGLINVHYNMASLNDTIDQAKDDLGDEAGNMFAKMDEILDMIEFVRLSSLPKSASEESLKQMVVMDANEDISNEKQSLDSIRTQRNYLLAQANEINDAIKNKRFRILKSRLWAELLPNPNKQNSGFQNKLLRYSTPYLLSLPRGFTPSKAEDGPLIAKHTDNEIIEKLAEKAKEHSDDLIGQANKLLPQIEHSLARIQMLERKVGRAFGSALSDEPQVAEPGRTSGDIAKGQEVPGASLSFTKPQLALDVNPRFSIRAHRPMFGSANRAIASLAVQHLMGEKLDTERAERAAYLFGATGASPDLMIESAKKLAESKVAQEAKKHIENRDPSAAHNVMSQQAEYDSIVALRTGMKSGLKMGQEAERAKQAAEKKLLLNARGEDLQQFIIDTGIDWTETLLSSLPEAFAEWEKARKDAEDKAKKEGAPEGPQQEPEAPPADPAELEARDRRMRELVAAVRAWGDAERAKREKEADDRRKKEQERIEKGESGEEADDVSDTDEGGEQAEGMEPEGLSIPKELLQAHGVDIRNAQEVAHLIRIWMADWLVRQSKGRLTHQTVWKDREAVEKYRKTMVAQLRDMANGMVEQGWSMTVIHNRISDIPSVAKADTVERRTASIVAMIQAHSIRQTRAQLITDIRKNIKKKAIKGKRHDTLNEDLQRKINNEQEQTARFLRRILTWSPEKVDAEIVAIQARLKERTELYNEQNPDVKVALDVEFHRDLMRLRVLQEWGGLKRLLPAQIKQAGIEIDGWLVSAQERLYRRWWAMEEQIAKLVDALHDAIVPDDPEQARIDVGRVSQWINDNVATTRQRLEGLIRQQHDPVKRQAAQAAIDEIMFILSRGTEVYRTVAHEYRQAFVDAVNEIAGGKSAATAYMKHLEEKIPIEVAEQVSRQGYNGRGGGRIMTYNQALQLYASITQRGYASNVKLHKREEHAALLESIFTTEDLALIARLREMYEERRGRLSEVVQEVSGMLVWRPDPLYMPVRVKMPKKGGFQSKGDPSTWMPLARSLTPRVHHGLDFDEGATLTGTFYDATEDAARAIGFGTRGLVLRGVLGNSAVQEAADRYYGGKEMADLNQQVVQALDGFGRTDQDTTHGWLRTVRELNAYAALSWNPLTALKQTVSFPVFAMALEGGFSHVMSAIKDFDRDAMREIMESDGFKARYKGGFMPEVAEILADGRSNIIARFYKLGMTTVQIGDFVPSLLVAPGLYKARLAQNLADGMDEATAKERAMTWTWEMIEATQQTSRAEMLPKFYRQTGAGSEAMKLILQFSSAPLLQLAHEYHAARDWRAGVEGAGLRLGRAILVNHIIIPQMLEMVKKMFYWLIGRDEPEDANLFWSILNGATIGAVSRIMIAGILADVGYNAIVHRKVKWGGQMVPAESLMRTTGYGMMAIGDLLRMPFDDEATMEQFQADLVRTLEGMLAPFRYGKEFYDNRIAQ